MVERNKRRGEMVIRIGGECSEIPPIYRGFGMDFKLLQ
jgi:hypothetical protein